MGDEGRVGPRSGAAAKVGSSPGEARGRPGWEKRQAPRSVLPLPGSGSRVSVQSSSLCLSFFIRTMGE